jgi:transcriptional repressor NrdR
VIDSRPVEGNTAIRRRRECEVCAHRFTTYERVTAILSVVKRSGQIEPFDAEKLRRGIESALADRPVPRGSVDAMVRSIEQAAGARVGPVSSEDVGALVLARLRDVDEMAFLRFASVYKDFKEIEDFEREMAQLEAGVEASDQQV